MSLFTGRLGLKCSQLGRFQLGSSKACGTLFLQALTASLSFVGNFKKTVLAVLAATLSFVGNITNRTSRALTAALSFIGAINTQQSKLLSATLSFVGNINRRTSRTLPATLSFIGSLPKRPARALSATLSFVGAISIQRSKLLTATLSFVGGFTKRTSRALSGVLSFIGVLATVHAGLTTVLLTATLSFSGAISRRTNKSLASTLAFVSIDQADPVAVADLNGNGRSDIIWQHPVTGDVYVTQMNGTSIVRAAKLGNASGMFLTAVGDFNGDNREELLFRNVANDVSAPVMWFPDSTGLVISAMTPVDRTPDWSIYSIQLKYPHSARGDGHASIIFRGDGVASDYVWCMEGASVRPEAVNDTGPLRVVPTPWKMQAAGNFGGDGVSGIFWRETVTGDTYVYMLIGSTITQEGFVRQVTDQDWQVYGAARFDSGFFDDVLWRHASTLEAYIYTLTNATTITSHEGYVQGAPAFGAYTLIGMGAFSAALRKEPLWWDPTHRILKISGITFNDTGDVNTQYSISAINEIMLPIISLIKRTSRALAATLSFLGALRKYVTKIPFTSNLSFGGNLVKMTIKVFGGVLTSAGNLSKQVSRSLAGTLSFVGNTTRSIFRQLAGNLSFIGNTVKRTNRALSGIITLAGTLSRAIVGRFEVLLEATLSFSGRLSVGRLFADLWRIMARGVDFAIHSAPVTWLAVLRKQFASKDRSSIIVLSLRQTAINVHNRAVVWNLTSVRVIDGESH